MSSETLSVPDYQPAIAEANAFAEQEAQQPSFWNRVKVAGQLAVAGVVAAVGLTGTAEAVDPAPAAAASRDYGDYLSGQLPQNTRCAADGRPISKEDINVTDWGLSLGTHGGAISANGSVKVGEVSLVYSPSCGTAWTRVETNRPSGINTVGISQDTGYAQSRKFARVNSPAVSLNSPMVYDHGNAYRAWVKGKDGPLWTEQGTYYTKVR